MACNSLVEMNLGTLHSWQMHADATSQVPHVWDVMKYWPFQCWQTAAQNTGLPICVQTCKQTKRKSLIESLPRSGTRPLTCPGGALETAQPRSPPSSMLPVRPRAGLLTLQLMEFRVSRWGAGLTFNSPHPCPSLPMSSNLAPYFRIMMGSFPPWTALPPMSKCPRLRLKGVNPRTTDPSKNREGTEGSNRST